MFVKRFWARRDGGKTSSSNTQKTLFKIRFQIELCSETVFSFFIIIIFFLPGSRRHGEILYSRAKQPLPTTAQLTPSVAPALYPYTLLSLSQHTRKQVLLLVLLYYSRWPICYRLIAFDRLGPT